jgi:hypothetical protein
MDNKSLTEYIARLVNDAPPFSSEQRQMLVVQLLPDEV